MAVHFGQTTVPTAGTEVQMAAARTAAAWVFVKPRSTNSGNVYVGGSNVSSTTGLSLPNTHPGVLFPFSGAPGFYDLSLIWVDVATNGDVLEWAYGS